MAEVRVQRRPLKSPVGRANAEHKKVTRPSIVPAIPRVKIGKKRGHAVR